MHISFSYVPPMRCVSPNMPSTLETVSCELTKQESLLGQIHFEMNAGFISKEKEDQLWGVQRNITQLKVSALHFTSCKTSFLIKPSFFL